MSRTEAILCLPQIITLRGCEEKNGRSEGYKGSTLMQALSCSWWKGTSRDEAKLISAEIKFVALAIFELCLSEGMVSQSVEKCVKYKTFKIS